MWTHNFLLNCMEFYGQSSIVLEPFLDKVKDKVTDGIDDIKDFFEKDIPNFFDKVIGDMIKLFKDIKTFIKEKKEFVQTNWVYLVSIVAVMMIPSFLIGFFRQIAIANIITGVMILRNQ